MEVRQPDGKLKLFEMKVEEIKPKTKANSRRSEALEYFVSALNGDRIASGQSPLSPKVIGIKMAHVPTDDLYPFFKTCLEYSKSGKGRTFSKAWFGALKVTK